MTERACIIAIDGPAGAGKSTVAKHLAAHFGFLNLETGAMYRAFALKAQEHGVDVDDAAALQHLAAETAIKLEPSEAGNRVLLDGVDVTGRIRDAEVTRGASRVSVHPAIRAWMVKLQRALGKNARVVMEGRDIGTVVFPHADLKFFLDASPEARSQRRYEQTAPVSGAMDGAGAATDGRARDSQAAITKELRERDERDRNRAESPLRAAADAIVIDSTNMTLNEVLKFIEDQVEQHLRLPVVNEEL
ncbi:MAG TPA: (d)CMP kinase [Acidobacteriaceae bacterium]|jgi:cytidylate kinase|nr:(d)CMP kinase [Acidobacteriaceae bacterium]